MNDLLYMLIQTVRMLILLGQRAFVGVGVLGTAILWIDINIGVCIRRNAT